MPRAAATRVSGLRAWGSRVPDDLGSVRRIRPGGISESPGKSRSIGKIAEDAHVVNLNHAIIGGDRQRLSTPLLPCYNLMFRKLSPRKMYGYGQADPILSPRPHGRHASVGTSESLGHRLDLWKKTVREKSRIPGASPRCSGPPSGAWWPGSRSCSALIYLLEPSHAFFSPYSLQTLSTQVALFGVLVGRRGGGDHRRRDRPVGRRGGGAVVGRQRQAADRVAPPAAVGVATVDRADRRLAIALTLADGPGHRPVARLDDQPAPAAAVHRHAGDDGRAAEPGVDPEQEPVDQRPVRRRTGSSAATPGGRCADLRRGRRRGERDDGGDRPGPAPLRARRQRDGRAAQRPADAPAQGGRLRPLGRCSRRSGASSSPAGAARPSTGWASPTSSTRSPRPSSAGAASPAASARSAGRSSACS